MNVKWIYPVLYGTIIATATSVISVKAEFSAMFNDMGYIEYELNDVNAEAEHYVALYNKSGRLETVRKNKRNDIIDADTGEVYTASAYFWNIAQEPIREKAAINNIKERSFYITTDRFPKNDASKMVIDDEILKTREGEHVLIPQELSLVDENADNNIKKIYSYLAAIANSKSVLFGHQNDITHKAGSKLLSESDTYDIVNDYAAVCGFDTLSLTGDEFSAYVCNKRYGTQFPETASGNVSAAAYISNKAMKNGSIITLSAHMPNFAKVSKAYGDGVNTYSKYDFSGYTTTDTSEKVANEILYGGKYKEMFCAYLDMIADYAKQVNGTIIFRPFHECNGSWFWWGTDNCDDKTYKEIYAYTVEYLRDKKNVHNLIYVYSPGNTTLDKYLARYPGDEYVDIVGVDIYNRNPSDINLWREVLVEQLEMLKAFALSHNKLMALTETGVYHDVVEGDLQTAFLKSGNEDKNWFKNLWEVVCDYPVVYAMVWSNFGENNGFYTPYVKKINPDGTLFAHEMANDFIDFYNNPRSVFSSHQKGCVSGIFTD